MPNLPLDPSRYILTVQGVKIVQVAGDTFFEFSFDNELVTDDIGGYGDPVRVISRDQRATLKVTLLQTSPSNDYLSGLLSRDLRANGPGATGGYAVGPSSLVDLNGTTAVAADETWITKYADIKFGVKQNTREWSVRFGRAVCNVGGNAA